MPNDALPATEPATHLPGLDVILNGFNSRNFDFLTLPVFDPDFEHGTEVNYRGTVFVLPVGVAVSPALAQSFFSNSYSRLLETKADYDEQLSVAATIEGELPIGFSASAGSNVAYHGQLFEQSNTSYALDVLGLIAYQAARLAHGPDTLHHAFKEAVRVLPVAYSPETAAQFFAFFDTFGTHFLARAQFGGYAVMESAIDDQLVESTTQSEIEAQLQVGFDGLVGSASLSAEVVFNSSAFLAQHRSQVRIGISGVGGTFTEDAAAYFASIFADPVLILPPRSISADEVRPPRFTSLSELVVPAGGDPRIATAIDQAIFDYQLLAISQDGLLGTGYVPPVATVNEAVAFPALVLVAWFAPNPAGLVTVLADETSDPQQVVSGLGGQGNLWATNGLVPMPTGYSYVVPPLPSGVFSPGLRTMTLQPGIYELGDYETLQPGEAAAANDGFVVCVMNSIAANASGPFAAAQGAVASPGLNNGAATVVARASETVSYSFTMVVPKGSTYTLSFQPTPSCPTCTFFWVPLAFADRDEQAPVFGPYETRTIGRLFQAQEDGFLMGLPTGSAAFQLWGSVFVSLQPINVGGPIDYASLLYRVMLNVAIPAEIDQSNSFVAPVGKGQYYLASTGNDFAMDLYWLPLNEPGAGSAAVRAETGY